MSKCPVIAWCNISTQVPRGRIRVADRVRLHCTGLKNHSGDCDFSRRGEPPRRVHEVYLRIWTGK